MLVFVNGFLVFDQIEQFIGEYIGWGEKGQVLLMDGKGLENWFVFYCDGFYVVLYDNGMVVIGSILDCVFQDRDIDLNWFVELVWWVMVFCFSLVGWMVFMDWVGVWLCCNCCDLMIGWLLGLECVYVVVGGFKIFFGIVYLVVDVLVVELIGMCLVVLLFEIFWLDNYFGVWWLVVDVMFVCV